jgi:serine/threonine-protein kinase HipA
MGRQSVTKTLYAFMNGRRVGELLKMPDGVLKFTYAQEWLAWAGARPISNAMPLVTRPYKGEQVLNYFDNLLPDNQEIRERIQARFGAPSARPFDLLSGIGSDCVGAIQLSTNPDVADIKHIVAKPVSDEGIAQRLKHYKTAPLGMQENDDFRISIAGAQEKTAFLWHEQQWKIPQGSTPTTHIFKLPIGMIAGHNLDLSTSCENEWLCLRIAAAFGLSVASASVEQFDDRKVLVVERFDRRWSQDGSWILRLPQEDLCQVLGIPSGLKYERDGGPGIADVMEVLRFSEAAEVDRARFMLAQIVFWLLAAIDGHGKNFSIFIEPEGRYRMTPFYDIMSAHPLVKTRQIESRKLKMAMAVIGKNRHYAWHTIQRRHWISTAHKVKFDENSMQKMLNTCLGSVEAVIDTVMSELPDTFPVAVAEPIFQGMRAVRDKAVG